MNMLLSWVFWKEKLRMCFSNCIKNEHKIQRELFAQTLRQVNDRCIDQKEVDEEDVCPICQEEYSWGNNVHIKYMKIWADHQDKLENDSVVKCPLCREKFAPLMFILEEFRHSKQLGTATEKPRLDRHLGIPCNNGRVFPIIGKCYNCTECVVNVMNVSLAFAILRMFLDRREIRNGELFNRFQNYQPKEEHLKALTQEIILKKRYFIFRTSIQCRLGLKSLQLGQHVRLLPCNHKGMCIESWLLQQRNTCPIDEYVVYNPLTWKDTPTNHGNYPIGSHAKVSKLAKQVEPEICVSGNGLFLKEISSEHASESSQNSFKKLSNKDVSKTQKDLILRFFSNLHLGESDKNSSRNLSYFSRHSKDHSLSSFETAFSGKSSTIRKDDTHDALRSQHQFDCGNINKVVTSKKDGCHNSTKLRYPRELNMEMHLRTAIHSSKKDNTDEIPAINRGS